MTIHIKDSLKKKFSTLPFCRLAHNKVTKQYVKRKKQKLGMTLKANTAGGLERHPFPVGEGFAQQGRVDLCHTSEFLFLLLSHPVDGEAGCSSKTAAQNFLVGLSLPVSNRAGVLCGKYIHKLKLRNFPRGSLLIIKISRDHCSKA